MFKPLLWGLKWNALNIWENKEEKNKEEK